MSIEKLMKPKSIVVIGVSDRRGSFGTLAANNAVASDIEDVYYVHPKRDELNGVKCYPSVADIPADTIDCAVIATPRDTINGYIKDCAAKGVKAVVVYASGFSEEHTPEGTKLEEEMVEICKANGISLVGPNCAGFINNEDKVNMWGMTTSFDMRTRKGGIAVLAQSGFISQNLLALDDVDYSYVISTGNGNVTSLEEYLDYVVEDDRVKVVAIYLEGIKDAGVFASGLGKTTEMKKPVKVLKSGNSTKSAASAASHTGQLAGSAAGMESVFEKFGVISVDTTNELVCTAQMISVLGKNLPKKNAYAGFNLSGGENTIFADVCEMNGVELPDVLPETLKKIEAELPGFATAKNPLDATTAVFGEREKTQNILKAFADDPAIEAIFAGVTIDKKKGAKYGFLKDMISVREQGVTLPMFALPAQEKTKDNDIVKELGEAGIVPLHSMDVGLKCVGKLNNYIEYDYKKRTLELAARTEKIANLNDSFAMTEFDSKEEIAKYGVKIPGQCIAKSEADVKKAVADMSFPLVMKVNSEDILHKTDAGAVKLNISSEEEAIKMYNEILANCKAYKPDARIDGILVQEMVPGGTEIIIGVNNDPQFGPMLLVGMGGVFVEVFKDVALYPCPINKDEANMMLKKLKAYKLLTGYRGAKPADIDALTELMVQISNYASENRNVVKEMDLNPVFVYEEGKGVNAVDALIMKYKK